MLINLPSASAGLKTGVGRRHCMQHPAQVFIVEAGRNYVRPLLACQVLQGLRNVRRQA